MKKTFKLSQISKRFHLETCYAYNFEKNIADLKRASNFGESGPNSRFNLEPIFKPLVVR